MRLIGIPEAVSIMRRNPHGAMAPLYPVVTARRADGILLQPAASTYISEQFGQTVTQPFRVFVDWPDGASEINATLPGDALVLADGTHLAIIGANHYFPHFIELFVSVPATQVHQP